MFQSTRVPVLQRVASCSLPSKLRATMSPLCRSLEFCESLFLPALLRVAICRPVLVENTLTVDPLATNSLSLLSCG